MAFDEALAERIRQGMVRKKGITEKKLFGCWCFLLHGNMCVGVWKESLIVCTGTCWQTRIFGSFARRRKTVGSYLNSPVS